MKLTKNLLVYIFIISFFFPNLIISTAYASGTNAGEFLTLGVGARPLALGQAFCAATDDIVLMHYNPAGLATVSDSRMTLMQNEFIQNQHFSYFAFATPLKNQSHSTLGLSVYHLASRNIDEYDYLGNRINDVAAYDMLASCTYAQELFPSLLAGVNLKYLRQRLYTFHTETLLGDIGFLHPTFIPWLTVGGSIQHIGPAVKFVDESFPLPRTYRLGASYNLPFLERSICVTADTIKVRDENTLCAFGCEINSIKPLSFRGGYSSPKDIGSKFTAGIGFNAKRISIDYAYITYGNLGTSHSISINCSLDTVISKSIDAQLDEEQSEVLYNNAIQASANNDDIKALEYLKQAKKLYPKNMKIYDLQKELADNLYNKADKTYREGNRIEDAISMLRNVLAQYEHKNSKILLKQLLKEKNKK